MKKLLVFILISCFSLVGCSNIFNHIISEEEIFTYVNENYELLESLDYSTVVTQSQYYPYNYVSTNIEQVKFFIEEQTDKPTIVETINFSADSSSINFTCYDEGFLDSVTEKIFYYVKDDAHFEDYERYTQTKPDYYEWSDGKGQKQYVKKIRDNWYYSEYYST